jgi:GGDEF domain-containing protein
VLWNCSAASAAAAIRRPQEKLDAYNRSAARGYDIRFSAGRVTADTSQRCIVELLLAEADARMYERKRSKSATRVLT